MDSISRLAFIFSVSIIINIVLCVEILPVPHKDPEVGMDMPSLVVSRGYPIETHYVQTLDGYILTMFRIPCAHGLITCSPGSPVLLQHGLLDSSYTWVNNPSDQSLGFVLADAGFDVWFGNNRGSRYGRNHTTLDPNSRKSSAFWDFSWDEMAKFDLPAQILLVLNNSAYNSLGYIGHSEGTTQMFAAGSVVGLPGFTHLEEALASVNVFVALAPVAYSNHQQSGIIPNRQELSGESNIYQELYDHGIYELLPYGPLEAVLLPRLCRGAARTCDIFLMSIMGPTKNLNNTRMQVYMSEFPAGTSMMNMLHWSQGSGSDRFAMFDWGSDTLNQQHYGSDTPPAYDLGRFAIPTVYFAGAHDYLADGEDLEHLLSSVPPDSILLVHNESTYAHMDPVWAPDAKRKIYPTIIQQLKIHAGSKLLA